MVQHCACSYLNLAVWQLIKPLYLSNGSPKTEHNGSRLSKPCRVFGLSLVVSCLCFQQLWLPRSSPLGVPHHWNTLTAERRRWCSSARSRLWGQRPTEEGDGEICSMLWSKNRQAGGFMRCKWHLIKWYNQSMSANTKEIAQFKCSFSILVLISKSYHGIFCR